MNNKGSMMILPPCVSCHHNANFVPKVGATVHTMICALQWKERGFKDKVPPPLTLGKYIIY